MHGTHVGEAGQYRSGYERKRNCDLIKLENRRPRLTLSLYLHFSTSAP